MELKTINCLYLELSQVATATTAKEHALEMERDDLKRLLDAHVSTRRCAKCGGAKPLPYRRDDLGGFVCLTCVEKRLDELINGVAVGRQAALELCWQIEKSGASEELTKCSVMASALQSALNELLP